MSVLECGRAVTQNQRVRSGMSVGDGANPFAYRESMSPPASTNNCYKIT